MSVHICVLAISFMLCIFHNKNALVLNLHWLKRPNGEEKRPGTVQKGLTLEWPT